MRFLIISCNFPGNIETSVYGVYKRFTMFLDAIDKIADIDLLFYVPDDYHLTDDFVEKTEKKINRNWNISVRLFLCKRYVDKTKTEWNLYPGEFLDFSNMVQFGYASRKPQIKYIEYCLKRQPDAIFVHRLKSIVPLLEIKRKLPPVFLDIDDIEHKSYFRKLKTPPFWKSKYLHYLKLAAIHWGERRGISLAAKTFVCSEIDKHYLEKKLCLKNIHVVNNCVKIPEAIPLINNKTILFLGSMTYEPNRHAADYLVKKVFPEVKQQVADAKLIIAGNRSDKLRELYQGDGIEFLGFVEDLDHLYQQAQIVCVPIFSGGGTRLKIIEAAAYGLPVVSTGIGAEGLDFENGKHIMIYENSKSLSQGCIRLLKDKKLCEEIGIEARKKAIEEYDRQRIISKIKKIMI